MLNQSGLLFVPQRWQRAAVLRWLKRVHGWTGLWGALLFLLMGTSGFLLNHRSVLKIDTGKPVEVSAMDITVPTGGFKDADALAAWAKRELNLTTEGKAPPRSDARSDDGPRVLMGKPHAEPEKWTRTFTLPDGRITIDFVPGAPFATVRREGQGLFATIKNIHKGVGLGMAWVLFLDSIAGALITMSITGFLLWTRLLGSRLVAGGIAGVSLALAVAAIWPNLL